MNDKTIGTTFSFQNPEGMSIFVRRWAPSGGALRAAVLIAHGAMEYGRRYERVAGVLNGSGYVVYAPDLRGHGMTAGALDKLGRAGPDAFNGMVRDLKQLADRIRVEHPGLPVFLLGHSMGSVLAQGYMQLWGQELQGVLLSGTLGAIAGLDEAVQSAEDAAQGAGADQPSALWAQFIADLNRAFAPGKTGWEWLTRDEAEVQKVLDDPWCGFTFSNALVFDQLQGMTETWRPENEAQIPTGLPLFIFSGEMDPAGKELVRRYRTLGMQDLQVIFYPGARHEPLNETNRDEVHADILRWLENHLA